MSLMTILRRGHLEAKRACGDILGRRPSASEKRDLCCSLDLKCPPKAHVLKGLVPSPWQYGEVREL